ncbi:MAG: hypothetical protein KAJ10_16530 [Thermodesulfovibrionia bacterium]|nr:hypothetical protein [Thermodesulfovibrionia bacterium]
MKGLLRHTDLTDVDLSTLKEMFRDLEDENNQQSILLTSFWNDLAHFWKDNRELKNDCQTWGQYWQKKKELKEEEDQHED